MFKAQFIQSGLNAGRQFLKTHELHTSQAIRSYYFPAPNEKLGSWARRRFIVDLPTGVMVHLLNDQRFGERVVRVGTAALKQPLF